MANMSAKFDEEAHNDLVSIIFTSLLPYEFRQAKRDLRDVE